MLGLLLTANYGFSQSFDKIIKTLKVYQINNPDSLLSFPDLKEEEKLYIKAQINLIAFSEIDSLIFNKSVNLPSITERGKTLKSLIAGDYYLYKSFPEDSTASALYHDALRSSLNMRDTVLITESIRKILKQFSESRIVSDLSQNMIKIYIDYLHDSEEEFFFSYYKNITDAAVQNKSKITGLQKALRLGHNSKNTLVKAKCNQMIGVFHYHFNKNNDSAIFYMNKARSLLEKSKYQYLKNELFGIYGNIGQYIEQNGNYKESKKYYLLAEKIHVPKYRYLVKVKLNQVLSDNSLKMNLKDSALYYLKKANKYRDTLNEYEKARSFYDLDKKYKTREKDLEIEERRKTNLYLSIGFCCFVVFGFLLSYLIIKNSRRKRLLALQEKELEKQKNITLIKEQEINTINAMVAGQEKERKLVAEDLHDNLGSVIATLKLHFDNLRINQKSKKIDHELLFDRTEGLIDDAYQKVRSIAHAKNAGVIANQGLLVAVQFMAEKISSANTIQINVIDFGLEKPLENSLEISLFRIIQELTTNIIKHAQASEATIHITQDLDDITILIEDNGIGMDPSKIHLQKGMGLYSIKTRVAHIGGSFTIDATPTKGTTVIIQVPT